MDSNDNGNGKMVRRRFWNGEPPRCNQFALLDKLTHGAATYIAAMAIEDALGIGSAGMNRDAVLYHLRRSLGSATVDTILTEIAVDKAHEKSAKELRLGKAVTS